MYRTGDVVLIPFPYTDLTATKTRPAVVVSSDLYLANYPDLVVCYISSRLAIATKALDYVIREWKEAGLLKPSFLRPKLATIVPDLVVLHVGALAAVDRGGLDRILRQALALEAFQ